VFNGRFDFEQNMELDEIQGFEI